MNADLGHDFDAFGAFLTGGRRIYTTIVLFQHQCIYPICVSIPEYRTESRLVVRATLRRQHPVQRSEQTPEFSNE